jgi:hypothetical protein
LRTEAVAKAAHSNHRVDATVQHLKIDLLEQDREQRIGEYHHED